MYTELYSDYLDQKKYHITIRKRNIKYGNKSSFIGAQAQELINKNHKGEINL